MKKSFLVLLVLLVGLSCSAITFMGMKLPLPGQSIAGEKVQGNTLCYVFSKVSLQNRKCRKLTVTDTKVVKEPTGVVLNKSGKKIAGTWTEKWTVDACGTKVDVPIEFVYRKTGVVAKINYP